MIVVDASVVLKILFAEEHSDRAVALFEDAVQRAEEIVAPPLLAFEVTNVTWRRAARREVSPGEAAAVLDGFLAYRFPVLPAARDDADELHRRAMAIARAHSLGATYDTAYVALAELLDAPLWTADRALVRALRGMQRVRWIGDYEAADN